MKKRLGVLFLLAVAFAAWRLFLSLGNVLYHEDPLARADVIFVLGGTRVERVAEAGHLYAEGWAPRILLSRVIREPAEFILLQQGLTIPSETDFQRDVLAQLGVPRDAVEELTFEQLSTASEAEALAEVSAERRWSRIIVVTSKLHTARAALAMRRDAPGRTIIVRASRYDTADVERWWSNRSDFRFVLFESQKLLAYWTWLAD